MVASNNGMSSFGAVARSITIPDLSELKKVGAGVAILFVKNSEHPESILGKHLFELHRSYACIARTRRTIVMANYEFKIGMWRQRTHQFCGTRRNITTNNLNQKRVRLLELETQHTLRAMASTQVDQNGQYD